MILLDGAPVASLEEYVKRGGGAALGIAVESGPDHVLDDSNLRVCEVVEAPGSRPR